MLYQLSYCGEPCGKRVHLISGGAPIGKENASDAARNRCGFVAEHSLIPVKKTRRNSGNWIPAEFSGTRRVRQRDEV